MKQGKVFLKFKEIHQTKPATQKTNDIKHLKLQRTHLTLLSEEGPSLPGEELPGSQGKRGFQ